MSSSGQGVDLAFTSVTSTGTYILNSVLNTGNWATTTTGYSSDTDNPGTCTISKFDLVNNKVSGTFSFKAKQFTPTVGTTVLDVTNGVFTDLPITIN